MATVNAAIKPAMAADDALIERGVEVGAELVVAEVVAGVLEAEIDSTFVSVDVPDATQEAYVPEMPCFWRYWSGTHPRKHPGMYGQPAPTPLVDDEGVVTSGHVPFVVLMW
jgi:hypothetical protein